MIAVERKRRQASSGQQPSAAAPRSGWRALGRPLVRVASVAGGVAAYPYRRIFGRTVEAEALPTDKELYRERLNAISAQARTLSYLLQHCIATLELKVQPRYRVPPLKARAHYPGCQPARQAGASLPPRPGHVATRHTRDAGADSDLAGDNPRGRVRHRAGLRSLLEGLRGAAAAQPESGDARRPHLRPQRPAAVRVRRRPERRAAARDAGPDRAHDARRDDRDRGLELLHEPRGQREGPGARRLGELRAVPQEAGRSGARRLGRQLDHAAADQERVHPGTGPPEAIAGPQANRGYIRAADHREQRQEPDPAVVPQPDQLRRFVQRRRSGERGLLRQEGVRPDAGRGRDASRHPAIARDLRPRRPARSRARPQKRGARPHREGRQSADRQGHVLLADTGRDRRGEGGAAGREGAVLPDQGASVRAQPHRPADRGPAWPRCPLRRRPRRHDDRSTSACRTRCRACWRSG